MGKLYLIMCAVQFGAISALTGSRQKYRILVSGHFYAICDVRRSAKQCHLVNEFERMAL